MSIFNERERSFEKRFAQEEELKFKATARRNHLLGLWAAKQLGLADAEAEAYAQSLVTHGIPVTNDKIRCTMNDFMKEAIADLNSPIR